VIEVECYPTARQRGIITTLEEVREALEIREGDQLKLTVTKLD
jgi:hypothetical protein